MSDQEPEPVGWIQAHELDWLRETGSTHAELTRTRAIFKVALYLAPPSESAIRASERELGDE
jgi:hypothetical protein